jgi:hypothetical protein
VCWPWFWCSLREHECCSCPVTANGLLTISVQDLTENPLTVTPFGSQVGFGVVDHQCRRDSGSARFLTHLQNATFGGSNRYAPGALFVTEDEFADAPLSAV